MDFSPLIISIKTAVVATFFTFITGILASWFVLQYISRFKNIIDSILTIPMLLPPTVTGFFLLITFGRNGFIGKILYILGAQVIFFMASNSDCRLCSIIPLMYKTSRGTFLQSIKILFMQPENWEFQNGKFFYELFSPCHLLEL